MLRGKGAPKQAVRPAAFDASLALPKKRSLTIAGHRTSITLEDAFWHELKEAAAVMGMSVTGLASAIDASRGQASLSAALRVFLLLRQPHPPGGGSTSENE